MENFFFKPKKPAKLAGTWWKCLVQEDAESDVDQKTGKAEYKKWMELLRENFPLERMSKNE